MQLHHRPTRLLLVAAIAGSLLAMPGSAAATPTIARIAPAKVAFGGKVEVRGTVDVAAAGSTVALEEQVGTEWKRVGTVARTDAEGAWRTVFAPRLGGALRAVQLMGGAGTSVEGTVSVVPKVLAPHVSDRTPMPFTGTTATWRIAPSTWPNGEKVLVELTIDGRASGTITTRAKHGVVTAKLPTNGVGRFGARLVLPQVPGYAKAAAGATAVSIAGQRVGPGASAAWARSLRAGLAYRAIFVGHGRSFDSRLGESVIAFHKAYGLPRTTVFEASDWKWLTRSRILARDTSDALHIEIDKRRQILMQVQHGKPIMVVHVSTGVTGNTPVGQHKIQWKGLYVPSLYGSLLYRSMAFQGAFAIHGYPSVPTTAASHGCVRVPMWIADTLYRRTPVGTPVLVYEGPGTTGASLGQRAGTAVDVPELTGVDVAPYITEGSLPA